MYDRGERTRRKTFFDLHLEIISQLVFFFFLEKKREALACFSFSSFIASEREAVALPRSISFSLSRAAMTPPVKVKREREKEETHFADGARRSARFASLGFGFALSLSHPFRLSLSPF